MVVPTITGSGGAQQAVRLRDADKGEFLAVRALAADVAIDGPLATTTLRVTFANDLGRALEGDLVFPLPPSAALCGLTVRVGSRSIQGRLRARDRARAEYTRAVQAGRTAALGESEGEDLARLRVAPIAAGEDVEITLQVAHTLTPTSDGHRLIVPLTYMPRFVEDQAALNATERAAVDRPRPLTLAARATVEITLKHGPGERPELRCASHRTAVTADSRHTRVVVRDVPLDRDLQLDVVSPARDGSPTLWLRHDPSNGADGAGPTTAVAVLPPPFADEGPTIPRTVLFLVDRSGSMGGRPMEAAVRAVRGSLRALEPTDRFNILAFDDRLEALAPGALPFDDAALTEADAFASGLTARGGTSASMALTAALGGDLSAAARRLPRAPRPDLEHRLRVIVFMTDGDVAGAAQVLQTARDQLLDTRLHVIGIGDAVNHGMLAELATLGGGTYTPVSSDEDLERALTRLKNAIRAPLWTGVKVTLDRGGDRRAPRQLEPAGALDLFAGQPLLLAFREPIQPGDRLVLEGQRAGGEDLRLAAPLEPPSPDEGAGPDGAALVWALLKNRRLTYRFDPQDDATLEALGATFGVVNRTVALVGVHPDARDAREALIEGSVAVSLPMPGNIAEEGGFPQATMTRSGTVKPRMMSAMALGRSAPAPAPARSPTTGAPPPPPAMGAPPPPPPGAGFGPPPAPSAKPVPPLPAAPSAMRAPPPPRAPAPAAPPPPPGRVMRSAMMDAMPMEEDDESSAPAAPARPALSDSEAGLRALLLHQRADGLFAGEIPATLAAAAALVMRGHTAREGLFRAELRRALAALRAKIPALTGAERAWAALAVAILTAAQGDPPPPDLDAAIAAPLQGLSLADLRAARAQIQAALAAAPPGWDATPLAADIRRALL